MKVDVRYRAPEYYAVWILDLFANHKAWNHASQLLHIFRDTQSQTIKRYAALAIGNCGSRSEALVFKEHISAATPLTRNAILISSAKLPRDERTHWRKSLTLSDPFEKAIPRSSARSGGRDVPSTRFAGECALSGI